MGLLTDSQQCEALQPENGVDLAGFGILKILFYSTCYKIMCFTGCSIKYYDREADKNQFSLFSKKRDRAVHLLVSFFSL